MYLPLSSECRTIVCKIKLFRSFRNRGIACYLMNSFTNENMIKLFTASQDWHRMDSWHLYFPLSIAITMLVYTIAGKSDRTTTVILTHLPLVPHLWVEELGHYGFRYFFARLFGAKPLSKPMLIYFSIGPLWKTLLWNFDENTILFTHENAC